MNSFDEVFGAVKEYCKEKLVLATYNLWIADIKPISFDGKKAVLELQSEFKCKTVSVRYADLLKEALVAMMGFDVELEFTFPEPVEQ
ncbi:MAG: DnaA N-terminal domain-containing protein, partial [Oscillospiraceae bacterium]